MSDSNLLTTLTSKGIPFVLYPLSLTPDYVSDWTCIEAVREIFQNAIDAASKGYPYKFVADPKQGTFVITTKGVTLTPGQLLLGSSSKRDDSTTIGQYGEGFKLALLVLLREGIKVQVHTGIKIWEPIFTSIPPFNTPQLCIVERNNPANSNNNHVMFLLTQIPPDIFEAIVQSNLHLLPEIDQIVCKSGSIITALSHIGKIYVAGLYVCDMQHEGFKYGYNFNPGLITLNRDRNLAASYEVCEAATQLWVETGRHDDMAQMINDNVKDVSHSVWSIPDAVRCACLRLFKKTHGENAHPVANATEQKEAKARGARNPVVLPSTFHSAITRASNYTAVDLQPKPKRPTPKQLFREFLERHEHDIDDDFWTVKIPQSDYEAFLGKVDQWTWTDSDGNTTPF